MSYNVLGTEYEVKIINNDERDDFPDMTADMDGYCNYYTKEIVVVRDDSDMQGHEKYVEQVVRHELVHAYLYESGLDDYSTDETLVDWMAIQVPKMAGTFNVINKPKNKVYRQKDYPADAVKGDIYYRPVIDESGNDFYIMEVHDGCEFKPV